MILEVPLIFILATPLVPMIAVLGFISWLLARKRRKRSEAGLPRPPFWRSSLLYFWVFVVFTLSIYTRSYVITTDLSSPLVRSVNYGPGRYPYDRFGLRTTHAIWAYDIPLCLVQQRYCLAVPIHKLADLNGHVAIRSGEEALAFVRLQTSLETCESFDDDFFEVIPGAKEEPRDPQAYNLGGLVTLKWMKEHHIDPPTVTKTNSGWTIHRTCLYASIDTSTLLDVIEKVGPDGEYLRTEHRFVVKPPVKMKWERLMEG